MTGGPCGGHADLGFSDILSMSLDAVKSLVHSRVEVQFGADTAAQCRTVTACRKKLEALEKRRKSQCRGQDLGFDQP